MKKGLFFVLTTVLTAQAQAASLMSSCQVWNKEKLNVRMSMMLVQSMGSNPEKLVVIPSLLTAIDDGKILAEGDAFDRLDHEKSSGVFESIDDVFYPVGKNGPVKTVIKSRQLSLNIQFKNEKSGDLKAFTLQIKPSLPNDSTFVGSGSMTVGNQTYTDVTYNCIMYIDWKTYKNAQQK